MCFNPGDVADADIDPDISDEGGMDDEAAASLTKASHVHQPLAIDWIPDAD